MGLIFILTLLAAVYDITQATRTTGCTPQVDWACTKVNVFNVSTPVVLDFGSQLGGESKTKPPCDGSESLQDQATKMTNFLMGGLYTIFNNYTCTDNLGQFVAAVKDRTASSENSLLLAICDFYCSMFEQNQTVCTPSLPIYINIIINLCNKGKMTDDRMKGYTNRTVTACKGKPAQMDAYLACLPKASKQDKGKQMARWGFKYMGTQLCATQTNCDKIRTTCNQCGVCTLPTNTACNYQTLNTYLSNLGTGSG